MAARAPARLTVAQQGRKFGLTVGAAFLVLAGILYWRGVERLAAGLGILGAALVLAGFVAPGRLRPVERRWMAMALVISKVTTPIFLGLVYFLAITPAGLLRRLFGKDSLRHEERQGSYLVARPSGRRGGDLRRQF